MDMLKIGCKLAKLANICLHKSTNYKFDQFFSSDSDLFEKIREDLTGGPQLLSQRKQ